MDMPKMPKKFETPEEKAEALEKWKAAAEEHREEVEDWMKYIRDLKFDNLEDLCEFCYAWTKHYFENPNDPLAAMKYATIAREFFPSFLREIRNQVRMQAKIAKVLKGKMDRGELDLDNPENLNLTFTEEDMEALSEPTPKEPKKEKGGLSFSEQFLGKKPKKLN